MSDYTYETEQQVIDAGERFERARYYTRVTLIATTALEEHPDDEKARLEYVDQDVDGDSYIIYTAQNLDVLRFTENDSAYEEADDSLDGLGGAYAVYQRVAFYAMRQDVIDELQRLIDELPEPEEEDADDDA